jgi:predicted HicB family RNase H-like nuclease
MSKRESRMGRPPLPKGQSRTEIATLRLQPEEHRQLHRDAKAAKLSVSDFLRLCWERVMGREVKP